MAQNNQNGKMSREEVGVRVEKPRQKIMIVSFIKKLARRAEKPAATTIIPVAIATAK